MKLKKIIENMNRMPSTLGGFNETPKLTAEQKAKLMDMVGHYNELGKKLQIENSLIETATALSEISELAETYACNEASDWFATEVVKRDFKRARGISETFQKVARECHSRIQQLNALYEDMGHILERYYEIQDPVQEVMPNPSNMKSQMGLPNANPASVNPRSSPVLEVKPNTSNLQSQRQLPANDPIKEVAVDDMNKNIKSQRDLPSSGPAPAQLKETDKPTSQVGTHGWEGGKPWHYDHKLGKRVWDTGISKSERDKLSGMTSYERNKLASHGMTSIDEIHPNDKNIKSQRDLPAGGPAPAQVKEVAVDDMNKNIKGQRDLPAGGPAPAQVKEVAVDGMNKNIKSQRDLPSGGPAPAQVKETSGDVITMLPQQSCKMCGKPVQRTLSAELCPDHANPKSVNVKEVAVDSMNKNIKSQRDLPSGGPTPYNPPKDPKDTGSIKETTPSGWEKTIRRMKKHKEIDNPWALSNWMKNKGYKSHKEEEVVNEVKPNDSNIKSQRDLPAGGPTAYVPPKDPKDPGSVKETTKLPSMQEILGLKK